MKKKRVYPLKYVEGKEEIRTLDQMFESWTTCNLNGWFNKIGWKWKSKKKKKGLSFADFVQSARDNGYHVY